MSGICGLLKTDRINESKVLGTADVAPGRAAAVVPFWSSVVAGVRMFAAPIPLAGRKPIFEVKEPKHRPRNHRFAQQSAWRPLTIRGLIEAEFGRVLLVEMWNALSVCQFNKARPFDDRSWRVCQRITEAKLILAAYRRGLNGLSPNDPAATDFSRPVLEISFQEQILLRKAQPRFGCKESVSHAPKNVFAATGTPPVTLRTPRGVLRSNP